MDLERKSAFNIWSSTVWDRPAIRTCHLWRTIIVGLPAIWSQVYVAGGTSLEEITTWVFRAANRPLDVYLDFTNYFEDERLQETIENVVSAWTFLSSRHIHSIRMKGSIDFGSMFPLKGNISQLHTLDVYCQFNSDEAVTFTLFPSHMPHSLRTLIVGSEDEPASFSVTPPAPLDLSHLEKLQLYDAVPLDFTQALGTCDSLRVLCWCGEVLLDGPPIVLPNLEYLILDDHELLESLELPKLHTLKLKFLKPHTFAHISRFNGLKSLIVESVITGLDTANFLASIGGVEYFMLYVNEHSLDIVKALHRFFPGSSAGSLSFPCPNLRVLECSSISDVTLLKPLVDRRVSPPLLPLEIWVPSSFRPQGDHWEEWMEKVHWGSYPFRPQIQDCEGVICKQCTQDPNNDFRLIRP
ncbi:hypothetical protein DL93DRAFT_2074651 [Clavulina sp. PMI_390]|nr:hypothetical protein DL93DRAFT_2074651 [Clavulina sp. PMI_390]